ncbi:MAG: metalloregulator ArsR/SmtB family transcription factor [Pseudomonadota bacterium]
MNDTLAADQFAALGHANRVKVLRQLVQAGCCGLTVGELRESLGVPASTFAHHLKALAQAGLVEQEKRGREVVSKASYAAIRTLHGFLIKDCCKGVFTSPQDNLLTQET